MIQLPDRLGKLVRALEAGQAVTQQDVDRVAALQVLDLARIGEDFARETIARNDRATQELERL